MTTPALQLPQTGTVVAGKYRVDAALGQGGMGAVFRATHTLTGRTVALKWLLPEVAARPHARGRFLREARAASRISHPNVVDVFDVVEDGDGLCLVMEYLDGVSLSQRLDQGPVLPSELPTLFFPVLRAVIAAHARGVIHRDLKPDNVMLCQNDAGPPVVKVLDFGISKLMEGEEDTALTRSGMAVGTPRYMSVEQLNGERELDARADVYALGVMLYEALTGVAPFDGESYGAIAIQVATGVPKRPRELCEELPEELDRVVLKAMERNREFRHRRVQDLLDDLERVLRTQGEARTESLPVPMELRRTVQAAERRARRWPWWVGLSLVALGLLVMLASRLSPARETRLDGAPRTEREPRAPGPPAATVTRTEAATPAPRSVADAERDEPPEQAHAQGEASGPRNAAGHAPASRSGAGDSRGPRSAPGAARESGSRAPTAPDRAAKSPLDRSGPDAPPPPAQAAAPAVVEPSAVQHRAGKLEREHF